MEESDVNALQSVFCTCRLMHKGPQDLVELECANAQVSDRFAVCAGLRLSPLSRRDHDVRAL